MARILFISHYPTLMGANRSMLALIDYLTSSGHACFALCHGEGDITTELAKRNIRYLLHFHYWQYGLINPSESSIKRFFRGIRELLHNRRSVKKVEKFIKVHNIDCIYSNSVVSSIGYMVASRYRLKHIYHIREFGDLDYDLYPLVPRFFIRKKILSSDAVICISKSIKEHYFGSTSHKNVHIVYNPIFSESTLKEIQKKIPSKKNLLYIVLVGYVKKTKGQHLAIEAISLLKKEYPDIHLYIVGPGEIGWCKQMVAKWKVENNVTVTDYTSSPELYYSKASISLMCSKNEGLGRVTIESMAYGLTIVGYDSYGTSEIITHKINGLLFEKFTGTALAEAIKTVLKNKSLMNNISANARLSASRYTYETCGKKILEIIA